jgi:hypothetical protein
MGPLESELSLRFNTHRIPAGRVRNIQMGVVGAEKQLGNLLRDISRAVEDLQNAVLKVAHEIDDLRAPVIGGKDDS